MLAVVVAVTGFAYLYMNELMTTDDPFALVNHPWQGPTLIVHIVAAPLFVGSFGVLLGIHALPKLRGSLQVNRRTGHVTLWTFPPMAVSAYLHQTATATAWVSIWWWVHVLTACAFVGGYAVHFVIGYRMGQFRRRQRRGRWGDINPLGFILKAPGARPRQRGSRLGGAGPLALIRKVWKRRRKQPLDELEDLSPTGFISKAPGASRKPARDRERSREAAGGDQPQDLSPLRFIGKAPRARRRPRRDAPDDGRCDEGR